MFANWRMKSFFWSLNGLCLIRSCLIHANQMVGMIRAPHLKSQENSKSTLRTTKVSLSHKLDS